MEIPLCSILKLPAGNVVPHAASSNEWICHFYAQLVADGTGIFFMMHRNIRFIWRRDAHSEFLALREDDHSALRGASN